MAPLLSAPPQNSRVVFAAPSAVSVLVTEAAPAGGVVGSLGAAPPGASLREATDVGAATSAAAAACGAHRAAKRARAARVRERERMLCR